ncbi:PilN domain-containing protein [bacterium]|nr:PilN domain-containing protein [bacterium]
MADTLINHKLVQVNLLGEKPDFAVRHALQILLFVGSIITLTISSFVLYQNASTKNALLEGQKQTFETQLNKLRKVTAEVSDLEKKKRMLREKLMTIAALKAKKRGPVRILDEIGTSVPKEAWIKSLEERDTGITLSGVALDNQTISAFMSNLSKSKYFTGVDLQHSTQFELEGVKVKEFVLKVGLKDALAVQVKIGSDTAAAKK